MRRSYNPLIALVQTLDDGIEFYRIAAQKARSPSMASVFTRMADAREFALAYIIPYIGHHDFEVEKSLTYHGTLSNRYAPLLEDIVEDYSLALVKEVEEHLVDAMIAASMNTQNALVQIILKDLAPRISSNYETCFKEAMARTEAEPAAESARSGALAA